MLRMRNSFENFEQIKTAGEAFYKSLTKVHCPYFDGDVIFNARGLEHLKFKQLDRARSENDQYMRFKLLHLAPEIIKRSHLVQGVLESMKFERVRVRGRTDTIFKVVHYYEFIAVIKRDRVKVIVKQVGDGEKFFWSIIPSWRMNKETRSRILHESDLDED
jgi:hypothetical protein